MTRRLGLLVALSLVAARAHAGQASLDALDVHPASTANGALTLDSAFTAPHLGFTAGIFGSWAHQPLVLRHADGTIPPGGLLIKQQLSFDVVASFALFDRVELGVVLPFVGYQETDNSLGVVPKGLPTAALGDLRIDLKVRAHTFRLGGEHRIGLAVLAGIRAPTGDSDAFLGQDGVSGQVRLIGEWRHPRGGITLHVGAVLRSTRTFTDLAVTHQIAWGIAGRATLWSRASSHPNRRPAAVEAIAEAFGLVGVGLPNGSALTSAESPAEVLVGVRGWCPFGFSLTAGAGAGLTRGYGVPDGRVLFALRYESPPRAPRAITPKPDRDDRDGDGVPDWRDRCPAVSARTLDGCPPPPDSDGDGVPDAEDRCPGVKGSPKTFGCPDVDSDGDGVVDLLDKCALEPGQPPDGCPVPDEDGDGVPDAKDRCPKEAGSPDNDGCPEVDSDGDGIVDHADKCPFEPETWNGKSDDDGCPDAGAPLVELTAKKLVLKQPVVFVPEGSALAGESDLLLRTAAKVLALHKEHAKIRVEVSSERGGFDLDLARARAQAVVQALVKGGVPAERLEPVGLVGNAKKGARGPKVELVF